jgi:hypothetical protein
MFGGLARKLEDLPLVVLGGLALIVVALPGVIGWFIGDLIWDNGTVGALIPYAVVIVLATIGDAIIVAIGAFVVFAPVTYVLILAQQTVLWAFGLSRYPGIGNFMVRNLDGVLVGAGVGALLMMKQWGRPEHGAPDVEQAWGGPSTSGPPGQESSDADEREQRLLFGGVILRFPLVFLIAGLADIPEAPSARIFVGSMWGIALAVGAILVSTKVYHDPVKDAWVVLALVEGILVLLLILGAGGSFGDGEEPRRTILQTVPPAVVACAATYLLVWATAVLRGRRIGQVSVGSPPGSAPRAGSGQAEGTLARLPGGIGATAWRPTGGACTSGGAGGTRPGQGALDRAGLHDAPAVFLTLPAGRAPGRPSGAFGQVRQLLATRGCAGGTTYSPGKYHHGLMTWQPPTGTKEARCLHAREPWQHQPQRVSTKYGWPEYQRCLPRVG